mgnify:CR=1 FL=1
MRLFSYWRSGTSYRVRIALALKGIDADIVPVNLLEGEHTDEAHLARNPQGLVPTLELPDGTLISQSPAIIEYLEEIRPDPPLLPANAAERARARQFSALVACDIHPLQNLRVLRYVQDMLGHERDDAVAWARHWITTGFEALERQLADPTADRPFALGATPGITECHLVPQVYGARRYGVDLERFPRITTIARATEAWPGVRDAHPDNQVDAPKANP